MATRKSAEAQTLRFEQVAQSRSSKEQVQSFRLRRGRQRATLSRIARKNPKIKRIYQLETLASIF
jgi:hypothetical protein